MDAVEGDEAGSGVFILGVGALECEGRVGGRGALQSLGGVCCVSDHAAVLQFVVSIPPGS